MKRKIKVTAVKWIELDVEAGHRQPFDNYEDELSEATTFDRHSTRKILVPFRLPNRSVLVVGTFKSRLPQSRKQYYAPLAIDR